MSVAVTVAALGVAAVLGISIAGSLAQIASAIQKAAAALEAQNAHYGIAPDDPEPTKDPAS